MDLLGGYGSDSDGSPPPSPQAPRDGASARGAAVGGAAPAAAPRPGLLFGMPAPKSAAPDVQLAPPVPTRGAGASGSGLPAGFFDNDSAAAAPPSTSSGRNGGGLPADFFDSGAAAAGPSRGPAAAPDGPAPGPALPPGMARRPPPGREDISDLPRPSDPTFLANLPAPKATGGGTRGASGTRAAKRRVLLKAQIDLSLLQGDSSDEEAGGGGAAAKRAKGAGGAGDGARPAILGFLPAPKNESKPRGGSGGGASGSGAGTDSIEAAMQRRAEQRRAQEAAAAAAAAPEALGNEAYRIGGGSGRAAAAAGPAAGPSYADAYRVGPAGPAAAAAAYHHQQYAAAAAGGYEGMSLEEAALQAALQEEADRAARRGAGGAASMSSSIQFQEVDGASLKYVDPARREANEGMRAALGTDYATQLRAAAAPFVGDKTARRKHQIGTLFANAKLKELEILENRAGGMKSKAETQGKYGW